MYLSPPHISKAERELVADAFDTNWIAPLGPHVDAFERELGERTNRPHAAALSSGTAGLHLALMMLGVSRGDEVLCSSLTFAASAYAITYVGAKPVFVDANRVSWNVDPNLLREEIEASARGNKLPKAVIVVDLYGQCADYDPILAVCDEYGIPMIEDAAEGFGASYKGKPAGYFGQIAIVSFNGNKIITTGGGGALLSNDRAFVERARFLATQARDPAPHYEHSEIGYNYRMSNVLAAIGRGQLRVLEDRVDARRANFEHYCRELSGLPGVEFMPEAAYGRCTRWLTCLTIELEEFGSTREEVRLALEAENIEARPVWKPMHLQPVFKGCRVRGGEVAEKLFKNGLCLPSGSSLTQEDRERVIAVVKGVAKRRLG
jgi:pyridoxal phosphate-dependent aminotransferase EpsN